MNPGVYILFTLIVSLALLGLFLGRRPDDLFTRQLLVLGMMLPALLIGLIYWLLTLFSVSFAVTGRLVYPAHAAITLIITGGLYLLTQRLPRRYQVLPRFVTGSPPFCPPH